jgi:hypothetical protein
MVTAANGRCLVAALAPMRQDVPGATDLLQA